MGSEILVGLDGRLGGESSTDEVSSTGLLGSLVPVFVGEGMSDLNKLVNSSFSVIPNEHAVSGGSDNRVVLELLEIDIGLGNEVLGIRISGVESEELVVLELLLVKDFLLNLSLEIVLSVIREIGLGIVEQDEESVAFLGEHVLEVSSLDLGVGKGQAKCRDECNGK